MVLKEFNWLMVLKEPNGLERIHLINGLERSQLKMVFKEQWYWKEAIDECIWKNPMVLREMCNW